MKRPVNLHQRRRPAHRDDTRHDSAPTAAAVLNLAAMGHANTAPSLAVSPPTAPATVTPASSQRYTRLQDVAYNIIWWALFIWIIAGSALATYGYITYR